MLLFYEISAWVFLIHMFLDAGFYCSKINKTNPQLWKICYVCGLHLGLNMLTAIYFRKARDNTPSTQTSSVLSSLNNAPYFFLITLP